MLRVCGKTSKANRCLWICCLLAHRLIYMKWSINIFNEYSVLSTSACVVALVSHSNKIIENTGWCCIQEAVQCPTRWQHMVRGIPLIQVVDWLVCHCYPAVNHTFCSIEWDHQAQNKFLYKYSWQAQFSLFAAALTAGFHVNVRITYSLSLLYCKLLLWRWLVVIHAIIL